MHWSLIPISETAALAFVLWLILPGKVCWADVPLALLIWTIAVGPSIATGLAAQP